MKVYHATTLKNWRSIQKDGWFRADRSSGRRKACWFASRAIWAFKHIVRQLTGGQRIEDVVVLTLDLPRERLSKHAVGLWYTEEDVPACKVQVVKGFATVTQKVR